MLRITSMGSAASTPRCVWPGTSSNALSTAAGSEGRAVIRNVPSFTSLRVSSQASRIRDHIALFGNLRVPIEDDRFPSDALKDLVPEIARTFGLALLWRQVLAGTGNKLIADKDRLPGCIGELHCVDAEILHFCVRDWVGLPVTGHWSQSYVVGLLGISVVSPDVCVSAR